MNEMQKIIDDKIFLSRLIFSKTFKIPSILGNNTTFAGFIFYRAKLQRNFRESRENFKE